MLTCCFDPLLQPNNTIATVAQWKAFSASRKQSIKASAATGKASVVIIAQQPIDIQADLDATLSDVLDTTVNATMGPQLAAGTSSTVLPSSVLPAVLPTLLSANSNSTLGFTTITGGGIVVATSSGSVTTAVQWTKGNLTLTLLGFWRTRKSISSSIFTEVD